MENFFVNPYENFNPSGVENAISLNNCDCDGFGGCDYFCDSYCDSYYCDQYNG